MSGQPQLNHVMVLNCLHLLCIHLFGAHPAVLNGTPMLFGCYHYKGKRVIFLKPACRACPTDVCWTCMLAAASETASDFIEQNAFV